MQAMHNTARCGCGGAPLLQGTLLMALFQSTLWTPLLQGILYLLGGGRTMCRRPFLCKVQGSCTLERQRVTKHTFRTPQGEIRGQRILGSASAAGYTGGPSRNQCRLPPLRRPLALLTLTVNA